MWWYDLSVAWAGGWDLVFAEADDEIAADMALSDASTEVLSAYGPRGPYATRDAAERAAATEMAVANAQI